MQKHTWKIMLRLFLRPSLCLNVMHFISNWRARMYLWVKMSSCPAAGWHLYPHTNRMVKICVKRERGKKKAFIGISSLFTCWTKYWALIYIYILYRSVLSTVFSNIYIIYIDQWYWVLIRGFWEHRFNQVGRRHRSALWTLC